MKIHEKKKTQRKKKTHEINFCAGLTMSRGRYRGTDIVALRVWLQDSRDGAIYSHRRLIFRAEMLPEIIQGLVQLDSGAVELDVML